jgi:hypothetical protein
MSNIMTDTIRLRLWYLTLINLLIMWILFLDVLGYNVDVSDSFTFLALKCMWLTN